MSTIAYQVPGRCSICEHDVTITQFVCSHCGTRTEGEFTPCRFCHLKKDQVEFIEVFLKCRGNIKDVEKELGVSYPTIRNRLDEVNQALGIKADRDTPSAAMEKEDPMDVLDALERGELSPREALQRLRLKRK